MFHCSSSCSTAAFLVLVIWCSPTDGGTSTDVGFGILYMLDDTQDVWLEGNANTINVNPSLLLVGAASDVPKKRFLVQFESIPTSCTSIKWAHLYVYFAYSGRQSGLTPKQAPDLSRTLQVHQVLVPWSESQATSVYRQTSPVLLPWSQPYLALDGTDAVWYPQDSFTMSQQPSSYIRFDVTDASRNRLKGDPNNGLLVWATNEDDRGTDLVFYSK
eukprot:Em0001g2288a